MLWRQRRWRFLLDFIAHLPRDSAYIEAVADDDEAADHMRRRPPQRQQQEAPRLSEWSPTVAMLADAIDRLGAVVNAVLVAGGGKPQKIKPVPRPVTAMTRATTRQKQTSHDRVRARVAEARARRSEQG